MDYIQVTLQAPPDFTDILTAELSQVGFDSFWETDAGLCAYTTAAAYTEADLQAILNKYHSMTGAIHYTVEPIAKKNWNEEWEKNFKPLLIAGTCSVRASFHPQPEGIAYDIIINPKMSFGTGHHETTTLMIENQLQLDHAGKRVLDMGCGTAILAILACKLGAAEVVAVDIEDWTVENARENADLNGCGSIAVRLGDADAVRGEDPFDLILANINRNVLLADIPAYTKILAPGGTLILSGFYTEDLDLIKEKAAASGLVYKSKREKNNWVSVVLER